jgi:hypothetical protein
MGHRGDVCERYYMLAFVNWDRPAICLRATQRGDLSRAAGRLARHELAPKASELLELFRK